MEDNLREAYVHNTWWSNINVIFGLDQHFWSRLVYLIYIHVICSENQNSGDVIKVFKTAVFVTNFLNIFKTELSVTAKRWTKSDPIYKLGLGKSRSDDYIWLQYLFIRNFLSAHLVLWSHIKQLRTLLTYIYCILYLWALPFCFRRIFILILGLFFLYRQICWITCPPAVHMTDLRAYYLIKQAHPYMKLKEDSATSQEHYPNRNLHLRKKFTRVNRL
jgi:hypothetical protein